MDTCYLIHGIKTLDPNRSSISFLRYMLPGFKVVMLGYGYVPVLMAPFNRIINWLAVRRFIKQVKPGQILIGHSNGCTVAHGMSMKFYTGGLVLINPALDRNVEFSPFLKFVHVYWSKKDRVTWLSKFVPFSKWGSMGSEGYSGSDPRVKQWEMDINHTDIGDAEIAVQWGPVITANIVKELKH